MSHENDIIDSLNTLNRRLHAEIDEVQDGRRCGSCWALTLNGHYRDCRALFAVTHVGLGHETTRIGSIEPIPSGNIGVVTVDGRRWSIDPDDIIRIAPHRQEHHA